MQAYVVVVGRENIKEGAWTIYRTQEPNFEQ